MPEPYWPKSKAFPLSRITAGPSAGYINVRCRYCKRSHVYQPDDLIRLFGDVDIDSLMQRIRCEREGCVAGTIDVSIVHPSATEMATLRIRRLERIKIKRIPIWRDG